MLLTARYMHLKAGQRVVHLGTLSQLSRPLCSALCLHNPWVGAVTCLACSTESFWQVLAAAPHTLVADVCSTLCDT